MDPSSWSLIIVSFELLWILGAPAFFTFLYMKNPKYHESYLQDQGQPPRPQLPQ
jgi:hypothetical protein